MRPLEVTIICLLLVGLAVAWWLRRSSIGRAIGLAYVGALAAVLVVHLWLEGGHWQMVPAYVGVLLLAALLIFAPNRPWGMLGGLSIGLLAGASCAFSYVLPMFEIPAPTGAYLVGTRIVSLTDQNRREDGVGARPGPREVIVQVWYPAQESHHPRAPYRRRSETTLASSYQSVDWTHSRYDAPVATSTGGFPVVLYNPGWNGRRTQDTMLTEDLASHGYVVVAIDHPYNSGPIALADGTVIPVIATPALSDPDASKEAIYALIDKEVEKETADTLFVLGEMKRLNADSTDLFFGHLDFSRVGALGYSLGGAVAAEAAYQAPEIRAVVDLDTPLYGEAGKHGIHQPLLFLGEDLTHTSAAALGRMAKGDARDLEMDEDDYARQLPMYRRPGDYQATLHGTLHTSFQDGILFSPLPSLSRAGATPAKQVIDILRTYTLTFFDQTLRGVDAPVLRSKTSPFPEATVLFPSDPASSR